jgi:hypothetical protein
MRDATVNNSNIQHTLFAPKYEIFMAEETSPISYEDLAAIEDEFEEVDIEISTLPLLRSQDIF